MKRVVVFVALLTGACSSSTGGDSDLLPLESKVVVDLRETHGLISWVGTPQPTLLLRTEKDYGCVNYVIRLGIRMQPPVLEVEILGIELPGNLCFTAFGPATARFDVPEIAQYAYIDVRYGGEVDRYELVVDEESFHLSGELGKNSRIGDTLVWRYPRKSMAFTCGTLVEDSWLCTQFRDTLLARLELQEITVPDIGYWPYPRVTMGHYYDMPTLVYGYQDESDFDTAGQALEAFTRSVVSNHSGAGLTLRNWRNEGYASWLVPESGP